MLVTDFVAMCSRSIFRLSDPEKERSAQKFKANLPVCFDFVLLVVQNVCVVFYSNSNYLGVRELSA